VRWFLFAILAYACLVVQTTFFRPGLLALEVGGRWFAPDLLLVLGVFLAMHFRPAEVFVAAWCLGFVWDLAAAVGLLGTGAILFSVVLAGANYARPSLGRPRVALDLGLALAVVFVVHLAWYQATGWVEGTPIGLVRGLEASFLDAAYSAVLAPYLLWVFGRLRGPMRLAIE
jgi:Kef-type K+ transport system membrane component KefB